MITVYASIGNSDDKLTQSRWCGFSRHFLAKIREHAAQIHGVWHSLPDSHWQNCCVCFEIPEKDVDALKDKLARAAAMYDQDSIAWAIAPTTEFISANP